MDLNLDQKFTSNYSPGRSSPVRFIILHATRGPGMRFHEEEKNLTVNYFLQPGVQASAHYVVGGKSITQMVELGDTAWHARQHNGSSIGIEIAQDATLPPFTEWQYRATAQLCRELCEMYNIPKVRVLNTVSGPGIIGHEDSEAGKQDGKSDPGKLWDWPFFLNLLTADVYNPAQDWQTAIDVTRGFARELRQAPEKLTLVQIGALLHAAGKQLDDVSRMLEKLREVYDE
jgi:N-acetyl-anhydromuramyl-L-alanine amidase AmpD